MDDKAAEPRHVLPACAPFHTTYTLSDCECIPGASLPPDKPALTDVSDCTHPIQSAIFSLHTLQDQSPEPSPPSPDAFRHPYPLSFPGTERFYVNDYWRSYLLSCRCMEALPAMADLLLHIQKDFLHFPRCKDRIQKPLPSAAVYHPGAVYPRVGSGPHPRSVPAYWPYYPGASFLPVYGLCPFSVQRSHWHQVSVAADINVSLYPIFHWQQVSLPPQTHGPLHWQRIWHWLSCCGSWSLSDLPSHNPPVFSLLLSNRPYWQLLQKAVHLPYGPVYNSGDLLNKPFSRTDCLLKSFCPASSLYSVSVFRRSPQSLFQCPIYYPARYNPDPVSPVKPLRIWNASPAASVYLST